MLEQVLARFGDTAAAFWSTHGGAELDPRLEIDGQVIGLEIKRTDRPTATKSMHSAIADLELDHLVIAHAGTHRFALADRITAIGAAELLTAADPSLDSEPTVSQLSLLISRQPQQPPSRQGCSRSELPKPKADR